MPGEESTAMTGLLLLPLPHLLLLKTPPPPPPGRLSPPVLSAPVEISLLQLRLEERVQATGREGGRTLPVAEKGWPCFQGLQYQVLTCGVNAVENFSVP